MALYHVYFTVNVEDFLREGVKQIPSLIGVKFSSKDLVDLIGFAHLEAPNRADKKFNVMYGCDEVNFQFRLVLMAIDQPFLCQIPILGYYANSAGPDQTPHLAASDQCLHCSLTEMAMENIVKMKPFTRTP